MDYSALLRGFASTVIYTIFGVLIFGLAFWVIVKVSPFSIRHEIETDHNNAVAILIAAVILGLALIIAATLHG